MRRYLFACLIILVFSGCCDDRKKEGDRNREIDHLLATNSDMIMDQGIVIDQILLTLKDIDNKLSSIPCILDLTNTPNTH